MRARQNRSEDDRRNEMPRVQAIRLSARMLVSLGLLLAALLCVTLSHASLGQGEFAVRKDITGTVGFMNNRYIAVVYKSDKERKAEYEMGFHIRPGLRLMYKRALDEFNYGDLVKAHYDEIRKDYERRTKDGTLEKGTKVVRRELKELSFLKPAKSGLAS